MSGIQAYGIYLPHYRLPGRAIRDVLGSGGGKGTRTVASHDEDTTSMGVEAARRALAALPPAAPEPTALFFATADPAYLEKSNAAAVHAALGLSPSVPAYDVGGAVRSGIGALRTALERRGSTLVVLADVRVGLAGGADEAGSGDAAVAFVTDDRGAPLAEFLGAGAATVEVLDRWRVPGENAPRAWEERFAETVLVEPAQAAVDEAAKAANIPVGGLAHVGVTGASSRAVKQVVAGLVRAGTQAVPALEPEIGYTGAAHAGLQLVAALEAAGPGEVLAVIALADGADALVFRATARVAERADTLAALIAQGGIDVPYATFLTWRGQLRREPPRRPENERPQAPPALRGHDWKYGLVGGRCLQCSRRHLPPQRVCVQCGAVDQMQPERMADTPGTIVTYTIDRVSFSPHPPVVAAVVEFDGGGRFQCELTDVVPDAVRVGQRVRMTFRRTYTAQGVHNYFWKARPAEGDV